MAKPKCCVFIATPCIRFSSPVWMGLFKKQWTWLDGSAVIYFPWKSGQPADWKKECVFAKMDDSQAWSTDSCTNKKGHLCEHGKCIYIKYRVDKKTCQNLNCNISKIWQYIRSKFLTLLLHDVIFISCKYYRNMYANQPQVH
jgi:hypothetical protein